MKKVTIKIPAKINLTLDITGITGGFHDLKSLVASIKIYDKITVVKRNDEDITLTEKGFLSGAEVKENNAYKAASLFIEKYKTKGIDIILNKGIPVGNGLGGSSADIAGVLLAMKKLYKVKDGMHELASKIGSDSAYMLKGGFSVISGKGDITEYSLKPKKMYLIIVAGNSPVSAKESYMVFDKQGKNYESTTDAACNAISDNDLDKFCELIKNDLYNSSVEILPEMAERIADIKLSGAKASLMSGSGSAVYGIYKTKKERDVAYKFLYSKYKGSAVKTTTI